MITILLLIAFSALLFAAILHVNRPVELNEVSIVHCYISKGDTPYHILKTTIGVHIMINNDPLVSNLPVARCIEALATEIVDLRTQLDSKKPYNTPTGNCGK